MRFVLMFATSLLLLAQPILGLTLDTPAKSPSEPAQVRSDFRVLEIEPLVVRCGSDESRTIFMHGEDIKIKTAACNVKLKDVKTKKVFWAYGAEVACQYKVGNVVKLTLLQDGCSGLYDAQCDLKTKKPLWPPSPYSTRDWFCVSALSYRIEGIVD